MDQSRQQPCDRQWLCECLFLLLLAAIGAGVRVWLRDLPNFAPVAALALFGGYLFRSRTLAVLLPLFIMGFSDLVIGGYAWQMMLIVYGSLAMPVLLGRPLRNWFSFRNRPSIAVSGLLGCSLIASLGFFLVTNFGSWFWFDLYPHTAAGLVQCYAAAVPFFRYTLAGDLVFATVLFGGYAVAMQTLFRPCEATEEVLNHVRG